MDTVAAGRRNGDRLANAKHKKFTNDFVGNLPLRLVDRQNQRFAGFANLISDLLISGGATLCIDHHDHNMSLFDSQLDLAAH